MKTKIKRHSRSVISVLLAVCMLISCMTVGLIATDAAKFDSDELVGYDAWYVKGNWSEGTETWVKHDITSSSFTINLAADTDYKFVFMANNDTCKENFKVEKTTTRNFPKQDSGSDITLHTSIAGNYTFKYNGMDGGQTCMNCTITFPEAHVDPSTISWTACGDNENLFGTAWATDAALGNDLSPVTAGEYVEYSKTWTNVALSKGTIEYKIAQNHTWDEESYPTGSANSRCIVENNGVYNVTVNFNSSTKAMSMSLVSAASYTLTVPTDANAVITATYNGVTAQEGGTLTVPVGGEVTIDVTPAIGKKVDTITATPTAAVGGTGNSRTLTMPNGNATFTVAYTTVGTKRVYFNNMYTRYDQVSAYAWYGEYENKTGEPLGPWSGATMTKLPNSNIMYIDVPGDISGIIFIGHTTAGDYQSAHETLPDDNDAPMYTPGINRTSPTTDHEWKTYTPRTNEYNVTKGSTMTSSDTLFTGIKATFYDYYTDGEAAQGNWIAGIGNKEYNGDDFTKDPFTTLNGALSAYANNTTNPKYGTTYPLYFGTLNYNPNDTQVSNYYNFVKKVNHSAGLADGHTDYALTGLTGKTLEGGSIRHYSAADTTNQNGAPMAIFDEDFLSGVNSANKTLASIVRSPAFPVRKMENVGATATIGTIYVSAGNTTWATNTDTNPHSEAALDAYFWGANLSGEFHRMTSKGNGLYSVSVPAGAQNVIFTRAASHQNDPANWSVWNQTGNITLALSGDVNTAKNLYTCTNVGSGTFSASLDTSLDGCTLSGGYTYYEYDSEYGKDNVYIEQINKTDKSAIINYYPASANNKVHSHGNVDGFYPFNRNNLIPNQDALDHAQDLGFGVKLEIPFTLNANGLIDPNGNANDENNHQKFNFSGDDDLWVFVDDKLILDLGGAHARTTGTIDFASKTATATTGSEPVVSGVTRNADDTAFLSSVLDNSNPNKLHTMTIYYMERGMDQSNLRFGFSFHAIPNQLTVEKKVRTNTNVDEGVNEAKVNSGFFNITSENNRQTGYTVDGKDVSAFEYAFNQEQFDIEQSFTGGLPEGQNKVVYTTGRNPATQELTPTGNSTQTINYTLVNDNPYYFIGQFKKGGTITLTETSNTNNKFVYKPIFNLYDDVVDTVHPLQSHHSELDEAHSFTFTPSTPSGNSDNLEALRLRARFSNQMVVHDVYLKKEINDPSDASSTFKFRVTCKIRIDNTETFIPFPLEYSINKIGGKLTDDGTVTVKGGDTVLLAGIPENMELQVTEVTNDQYFNPAYAYDGITVTNSSGVSVTPGASTNNEPGGTFTVGASNYTVVIKNSKGEPVRITHSLKTGSQAGTTIFDAWIMNGNTEVERVAENASIVTVGTDYITRDSSYTLKITLKTYIKNTNTDEFKGFYDKIQNSSDFTALSSLSTPFTKTIDNASQTATVTIPIRSIFDSTTGKQLYKVLPFFSNIESITDSYVITYKYNSRIWKNQAYVVRGTFTANELQYLNAARTDFKDDGGTSKAEFLYSKAPYEENFREKLVWNVDTAVVTKPNEPIEVEVTSTGTPDNEMNLTIQLPYKAEWKNDKGEVVDEKDVTRKEGMELVPKEDPANANKVMYTEEGYTKSDILLQYMTYPRYSVNGQFGTDEIGNEKYVNAPAFIWDKQPNGEYYKKYFSYWKLKDQKSGKEYAKNYSQNLNTAFYCDSIAEAVYENTKQEEFDNRLPKQDNITASITLMDQSRNQWNEGNKGDASWDAADRLISDYILAFNYDGQTLKKLPNMEFGMLFETVREIDTEYTEAAYYANLYKNEDLTDAIADAKDFIEHSVDNTNSKYLRTKNSTAALDNKNQIQYTYTIKNSDATLQRENKVYRVYSFLKDNTGVLALSEPIYVTLYDKAHIENGSDYVKSEM